MMNKIILNISILSLSFVLISCANESTNNDSSSTELTALEKNETNEPLIELEEQSIELTSEQKEAFQVRAIQKFQDFIDHLKIISAPNLDKDLKEHSLQLALALFINDSTSFSDSTKANSLNVILLKNYLKKINSQNKSITIYTENILIHKPLKLDSLNTYNGVIEVQLRVNKRAITKKIDIHLVKIEKNFGDNQQYINEVRLGNIY